MPRIVWQALSVALVLLFVLCEVTGNLIPWNGDEVIYQWGGVVCLGAGIGSWFERPMRGAGIALLVAVVLATALLSLITLGIIAE